jgi:hypothetical protein
MVRKQFFHPLFFYTIPTILIDYTVESKQGEKSCLSISSSRNTFVIEFMRKATMFILDLSREFGILKFNQTFD